MSSIQRAATAPRSRERREPRRRSGASRGLVVYERKRGWAALDLRELWAYRELLFFLTWRDILVRYKQAVLGVAWAILQPFLHHDRLHAWCSTGSWASQSPDPGHPLCGLQLHRASALAVLRRSALALRREPGRQRQPAHQGLLPAAGDPHLGRAGRAGRLRHLVRDPARADGRLRHRARPGTSSSCRSSSCWLRHGPRREPLAERPQRALPRRAVHHPLPGAAVDVREPGDLPHRADPRRVRCASSSPSTP